jgi:hypothetical protein
MRMHARARAIDTAGGGLRMTASQGRIETALAVEPAERNFIVQLTLFVESSLS